MVKAINISHNSSTYEKELKKVAHNKEKSNKRKNTEHDASPKPEPISKPTTIVEHPLFIAIIPALIVAIISAGIGTYVLTKINENNINTLNSLIESTKKDLGDDIFQVSQDLKNHESQANLKFEELNRVIGRLQGGTGIASIDASVDEHSRLAEAVQDTYQSNQPISNSTGLTLCSDDDIIGTDINTGIKYTKEDLKGINLILHYVENGDDIYFNGQYDDNGNWDKNCVINRYSNGILTMIMDAVYDSGILISYEQVFTYTKKDAKSNNYDVWAITNSEAPNDADVKNEYTWTYFKSDNYIQNFNTESAESNDIISVKEFKLKVELFPEGYYSGRAHDGYYNSGEDKAILIKYFKPGEIESTTNPVIRTFYQGKIADGQFDDNSYDSWYITRDVDTTYMYYRGGFSKGNVNHRDTKKEDFVNYLTHEQIDEYLKQYGFLEYSGQFVANYENQE